MTDHDDSQGAPAGPSAQPQPEPEPPPPPIPLPVILVDHVYEQKGFEPDGEKRG